nr:FecR domain-containing protein [Caulobacter hibisci]
MAAREAALQFARRSHKPARPWRSSRGLTAAIIVVAVITAAGVAGWTVGRPATYETALGERRVLTLADGSRVALDSDTRLEVRLKRHARNLELVRGQARFDVAHVSARPFSVRARDQVVVATGTNFNVDLLGPKVLVTLIEGRVTILKNAPASKLPFNPRPPPIVIAKLTAGQQLAAVAEAPGAAAAPAPAAAHIEPASVDRAVAWETGQLVFADEPLGAVAQRVGRYSPEPIFVEGPSADLRLSGVFNAGDVETFIDAVQRTLPVRATRTPAGIVLRSSR